MPSPVRPSQIKETIPSAIGNFCEKFIAVLRLPALFYQIYLWWYYEDGSFTEDFKAEICLMRCQCAGLCPGGGGPAPPGTVDIPKPQTVQATDGTQTLAVIVTWASVVGAESYEIWRSDFGNALGSAFRIGTAVAPTFTDSQVETGKIYWYWVRAKKGVAFSVYSDPDSGYATPNLVNGFVYFDKAGIYNFYVPAGVTGLIFDGLGSGGGGGGGAWTLLQGGLLQNAGGGGGGGGAGRTTSPTITVSPGELLTVVVGAGGFSGAPARSTNSIAIVASRGQDGSKSGLYRASNGAQLAIAPWGGGGGGGQSGGTPAGGLGGAPGVGNTGTGGTGVAGDAGPNGFAHGGPGAPGSGGAVGAGGNGGSVGGGGVLYSAINGRDGAVKLSW